MSFTPAASRTDDGPMMPDKSPASRPLRVPLDDPDLPIQKWQPWRADGSLREVTAGTGREWRQRSLGPFSGCVLMITWSGRGQGSDGPRSDGRARRYRRGGAVPAIGGRHAADRAALPRTAREAVFGLQSLRLDTLSAPTHD